jgi:hypothetical protein
MTIKLTKRLSTVKTLLGDSRGVTHLLVPMLVFAVLIGATGAYFVTRSHAATVTPVASKYDCNVLGRVWNSTYGKCTNTCTSYANGNYLVTSGAYNYCKGNIAFISSTTCANKHRVWSSYVNGCARRNQQVTVTAKNPGPIQCQYGYARYVVMSPYDKCDTPYTPSPSSK